MASSFPDFDDKIKFIKKISPGLSVLMTCSCIADDIAISPECNEEKYIKDNILDVQRNAVGDYMKNFCETLFGECLEEMSSDDVIDMLRYFDNKDMYLERVYQEASIPMSDFEGVGLQYAQMIEDHDLITFQDLIEYKINDDECIECENSETNRQNPH